MLGIGDHESISDPLWFIFKEDGHRPRDTFLVLPSREEYPDYYEVIQEPIDLALIRERMDTNKVRC